MQEFHQATTRPRNQGRLSNLSGSQIRQLEPMRYVINQKQGVKRVLGVSYLTVLWWWLHKRKVAASGLGR